MRFSIVFCIICLLGGTPGWAIDCVTLVRGLGSTQRFDLGRGAHAILIDVVANKGKTTTVWEAILFSETDSPAHVALRRPKYQTSKTYITQTIDGYEILSTSPIHLPQLLLDERDKFAAFEWIPDKVKFKTFFENYANYSQSERLKLREKFIEFARHTFEFERIPDFYPNQIVYDVQNERWVFLDWALPERIVKIKPSDKSESTLFDLDKDFVFNFWEGFTSKPDRWQRKFAREARDTVLEERSFVFR